jgi:hypothetical protein
MVNSTGDIIKVNKGIQTAAMKIADKSKEIFTVKAVNSSGIKSKGVTVTGYTVGSTGLAGGQIFYVNTNALTDGWTYLEAAPSDQIGYNGIIWGGTTYQNTKIIPVRTYAEGTAIGTGKSNTETILAALTTATVSDSAAMVCKNLSITNDGTVYSDWFLPSKDEIDAMFTSIGANGTFVTGCYYWSSSEIYISAKENHSWVRASSSSITYTWKCYKHSVRACRRF